MSFLTPLLGKRFLLGSLLLLLVLPAVQARLVLLKDRTLDGYVAKTTENQHPDFSWSALLSSDYQPRLERYAEARTGFRGWLIRLRNQLAYSLLHAGHAQDILIGRDQVLYEAGTVRSYLGQDAVASTTVATHVRRFRAVQDTLARRGKLLVYVVAPSKASFMPENLPAYFRQQPRQRSNYEAYTTAMQAAGINLLDLSRAFRQWKDTSRYPLFPRGGTHWSIYGSRLAGDTLMRYLQRHYPRPLRTSRLQKGEATHSPQDSDNDIAKTLNLLWPPATYRMAYPTVAFAPLAPGQYQPNLLLIGDSFCWSLLYSYINEAFDNQRTRFWYYNNEVLWPANRPEGDAVWAVADHKQQYLSRDIILVLFTEYNMTSLDKGFSDDAYKLFNPSYSHADSLRISELEKQIAQTPNLAKKWWEKSTATNRTLPQLIHEAAVARYDSLYH